MDASLAALLERRRRASDPEDATESAFLAEVGFAPPTLSRIVKNSVELSPRKSSREEVNPPPPPNNTEKTELQREPCPQCGRLFKLERLDKHIVACERAHRKRAPLDVRAMRWRDAEVETLQQLWKLAAQKDDEKEERARQQLWRRQSLELRAAVKAGAKQSGPAEEAEICLEALPDDRVECPHCSRKFAPGPAERHIAACKDIRNKPTTLQRGTGTAAGAPSPRRPHARPPSTPGRMPSTPGAASPGTCLRLSSVRSAAS